MFIHAAPPNATVDLEDVRVLVGEDAIFTCIAVAEPEHTTQWYFEGMLLNGSDKYGIGRDELGSGDGIGSGLSPGTLLVYDTMLQDAGVYRCVVTNIHGNDSSEAQLYIQGQCMLLYTT